MKKCIIIVLMMLIPATLGIDALEISTPTSEVFLYGGESVSYNITLEGTETGVTRLSYFVEPDSEGVTVTFSDDAFILHKGESMNITVTLSLVPYIKPGTYEITVFATGSYLDPEVKEIVKETVDTEIVYVDKYNDCDNVDELLEMIERLSGERNEYKDSLDELKDKLSELENRTDNNMNVTPIVETSVVPIVVFGALSLSLLFLILETIYILTKRRK